jgi:uncharacterized membrane protein
MNTPQTENPYAAPGAAVQDVAQPLDTFALVPNGQAVSAGDGMTWITDAFSLFARSWVMWVVIGVLLFVGLMVLAFIPVFGSIAQILLMPVIAGGLMLGCKAQEEGQPVELSHMFAAFKTHTAPLMVVGALYFAAIMVVALIAVILAVVTLGGSALMGAFSGDAGAAGMAILPILLIVLVAIGASVPILMAYWFAPPLVVFHNLSAIDAMKMSFFGCLKNVVPFLIYGVVFLVIAVVAMIPLGLGLLVVMPVAFISMYTAYKAIFVAQ